MSQAKAGDRVRVHYTGTLDDGTEFDSSVDRDPLEFIVGTGAVIPGFDQAVVGMTPGDSKTVRILVNDAYGPHDETMVREVERSALPDDIELEEGMQLQATGPRGAVVFTVTGFSDDMVTLDANHPLAGRDLTFDIELIEIL
ncbi:MAG TPA: peptidylprolyl isomerase [Alphaproteobacteria bacterium]|jgi:FKBP-type peptidyl-prolyl cis-trans isomerase 2|nr:peptidylprolyl isomerase [Alphaproteobacteria bacterium]